MDGDLELPFADSSHGKPPPVSKPHVGPRAPRLQRAHPQEYSLVWRTGAEQSLITEQRLLPPGCMSTGCAAPQGGHSSWTAPPPATLIPIKALASSCRAPFHKHEKPRRVRLQVLLAKKLPSAAAAALRVGYCTSVCIALNTECRNPGRSRTYSVPCSSG